MFWLMAIVCMVLGTGLTMQAPILGGLCIASAFGFGYLGQQFPAAEERFWAVLWLIGLAGIVIGLLALLVEKLF